MADCEVRTYAMFWGELLCDQYFLCLGGDVGILEQPFAITSIRDERHDSARFGNDSEVHQIRRVLSRWLQLHLLGTAWTNLANASVETSARSQWTVFALHIGRESLLALKEFHDAG